MEHRATISVIAGGAVVFALLLAGVGSGALTNEPTGPSRYAGGPDTDAAGGEPAFAITRVQFGSDGFVEITNVGDGPGSFDGWFLCQRPSYVDISSGGELAPGVSVQIPASAGYGALDPEDGEMGLYTASSFASSDAIVSYVEWGEDGHGRSSVAVEAGIWDGVGVSAGGADAIVAANGATGSGGWTTG